VGYYIVTVGEVNHEIIKRYIENQGRQEILEKDEEVELYFGVWSKRKS